MKTIVDKLLTNFLASAIKTTMVMFKLKNL